MTVEIHSEGDDPEFTRLLAESLSEALSKSLECKLCDYVTIKNTPGEMLEELGQHGEKSHAEVFAGEG